MYLAGDDVSEDAEVKSAVCIGIYSVSPDVVVVYSTRYG
jgi:hypothetical protein